MKLSPRHLPALLAAALTLALALAGQTTSAAEPPANVEKVFGRDGKSVAVAGGQEVVLEKELKMAFDVLVTTNGTFKVKEGRERALAPGVVLHKDGRITNSDGSIVPVQDHLVSRNNRIEVIRDGEASVLGQPLTLGDGSIVTPDGWLVRANQRSKLIDGQLLKLEGGFIPTFDTASLKNGRVLVQKDGAVFPVAPSSNLTMNDGTRVFGNGTVVYPNGTRHQLAEGEILRIQGVVGR